MLPLDDPVARTLLVRDCAFEGTAFVNWDVDLVPPGAAIDEDLKRDILGARTTSLSRVILDGAELEGEDLCQSLTFAKERRPW
jgi:hypothetical protein